MSQTGKPTRGRQVIIVLTLKLLQDSQRKLDGESQDLVDFSSLRIYGIFIANLSIVDASSIKLRFLDSVVAQAWADPQALERHRKECVENGNVVVQDAFLNTKKVSDQSYYCILIRSKTSAFCSSLCVLREKDMKIQKIDTNRYVGNMSTIKTNLHRLGLP